MKPILVINDLHIPFQRPDILQLIKKCGNSLDAIIFGGDIIDCKSISSFPNLDDITIEKEIEEALKFMTKVREYVGDETKIICIRGNHEARWETYISKMHDKKLYKFINPNILCMLKDGMTLYNNGNKRFIAGVKDIEIIDNWYINYNGVIVCHPTNFYTQPTKNATQAAQYFIDKENFSTLVCGHSHHQATCYYLGKWVIESGCCCKAMDYFRGKTTTKIEDFGLVYIEFDEKNNVDINNSTVYHLE